MTSKKRPLGAHNPMVADLLHIRQGVRSPQPICITGFNYSEDHQMAHNKAHRGSNHNEICRQAYLLHLKESFWDFLPCKGKVPIGLNGYYLKDWNDKKFSIKDCLNNASGATGIGVKTGLHLLCKDIDGETAFNYAADLGLNFEDSFQVHRDDDPWRFKVLYEPTPKQIAKLPHGQFQGKVVTKEAVKDANGDVIKKGEALEVFLTNDRQVLITGKHPDNNGNYFWPRGYGPEDIKPPSDEVWNFVLKLANQQDAPKETKYCRSSSPVKRLNPCPICGRNRDLWCGETPEGLILCMNGNTFSAERKHGPLKITDVVDGQWALVKKDDLCNTFKPHTPLTRRCRKTRKRKPSSHKHRRSAHVS